MRPVAWRRAGLSTAALTLMVVWPSGLAAAAGRPVAPNRFEQRLQGALGPRKGTIVVMRVSDGKLLAVVNPALAAARALPPGSLMKVPTVIAAWEERLVTPQRVIHCQGPEGMPSCWQTHGEVDVVKALSHSCSAYTSTVARELGPKRLTQWWSRFGFGRLTGADLPGEVAGRLPVLGDMANIDRNAVGDSASVAVTPLQLVSFYGALANGGRRWRPSRSQPAALAGLILPSSDRRNGFDLQVIRLALQEAAIAGSAKGVMPDVLSAAGKTGTASMPGFKGRTSGWFAGYAPALRPQIAVVVALDDAKGYTHAVPLARKVLQAWLDQSR